MNRRERSAYFRYRLLARFAEVLPVTGIHVLGGVAGRLGPAVNPKQAALVRRNLRRVLGHEPDDAAVREAYASYVRYWLHAFRLPVMPRDYLDRVFVMHGKEHIDRALENGKGVILAVPHVGNWDVAGAWVAAHIGPLRVVAERLHPGELHQWFEDFRSSLGMSVVVNGPDVAKQLTQALHRNEIIALLCDRDVDGTGGEYEFFGEKTTLPKGPALLALRTGAALIPVAAYDVGRTFCAMVDEPVPVARSKKSLRDDVDDVTQVLTGRIEELIRKQPSQWHLFQPNWPSDRQSTIS